MLICKITLTVMREVAIRSGARKIYPFLARNFRENKNKIDLFILKCE